MPNKKKCWNSKGFSKGHQYHKPHNSVTDLDSQVQEADSGEDGIDNRWLPRMSSSDYSMVVKTAPDGTISTPDADGTNTGIHVLRPRAKPEGECMSEYLEGNGHGEMRFLHMDKLVEMFNHSINKHQQVMAPSCALPQFEVANEMKKGVCWKITLKCQNCSYTSDKFKLYEEVESEGKKGPKFAKPNLGLQVGLQETPISKSQLMVLLACMNCPPPCSSSLQQAANKVGDITSQAAEKDLKQRCNNVKYVNTKRGQKEDAEIPVSIDCRYNSNSIGAREKMGQNASLAIATLISNQTDKKEILGISIANKLCHKGALQRSKGIKVSCPGHPGCSATQKAVVPFSEYQLGKNLGTDLARQGVKVKFCCTDGDGRSSQGLDDAMSNCKVERQSDTTHHSQSLYRHILKAKFSDVMFPGDTKAIRRRQQQMFAKDVKIRCRKIFRDMFRTTGGRLAIMQKKMPEAINATIECYGGNCEKCRKHSVVCPGGKKSWRVKSKCLNGCNASELHPNDDDKALLRTLINFDLGERALVLKRTNSNTNRNEAVNRSLSASLPKNVNFSRNAKARAYASVCRLNKGKGKSVNDNLEVVGCPVSKGGRVAKSLIQIQKLHRYFKNRSQSKRAMKQRTKRMLCQMDDYLKSKQDPQYSDYCKGQLDPDIDLPEPVMVLRKSVRLDHAYHHNM